MSMKLEENEDKVNEAVKQRMKDLHNKGQYDLSQSPEEYEKIIVKLEAEVRNHISVQQQMKLYIESYQSKVEELEPLEEGAYRLNKKIDELTKLNTQYANRLESIKSEMKEERSKFNKKLVESEREYDIKIEDLEIKIKELQSKFFIDNLF
jgi:chromosome segregation ATPase